MRKLYFFLILLISMAVGAQAQTSKVTFQVDMQNEMTGDTVSAAGSFQADAGFPADWTPGTTVLTDSNNDAIWVITVDLPVGNSYEFKYINGVAWGADEGVPGACAVNGNRGFTVPATDTILPAVCFASCDPCPAVIDTFTVTLQVNMVNEFTLNGGDTVSVAGDIQGAAIGGGWNNWTPGETRLTDNNDSLFTITMQVPTGTYAYKFLNGTAWGTEEGIPSACNVGGNRELALSSDTTITVCFGTCDAACPVLLPPVSVTFRVDLNNEIQNSDGIHVAGTFQNPVWVKNVDEMTDTDGDGVFEFTTMVRPDEYQYKFINGDEDSEEETHDFTTDGCGVPNGIGGSNRLLDIKGLTQDTVLPIFVYNSCATSSVGIADDLNAKQQVKVYPNPFTQSTTLSFSNEQGLAYSIEVLNLNGQVVRKVQDFRGNELEISGEGMAPGMYLLSISNQEGERYTRKLIMK